MSGMRKRNKRGRYMRGPRSRRLIPHHKRPHRKFVLGNIPRGLLPNRIFVKMKYAKFVQFNDVTSTPQNQLFNANSLFDPDLTGVGSQSPGYDELSALYERYRVYGCKAIMNITQMTQSTPGSERALFTLVPVTDSVNPFTTVEALVCNPKAKFKFVSGSQGENTQWLSLYTSCKGYLGVDPNTDDDYSGATGNVGTGSDPSKTWQILSAVYPSERVGGLFSGTYLIKLTYYAEFYQRKELNLS